MTVDPWKNNCADGTNQELDKDPFESIVSDVMIQLKSDGNDDDKNTPSTKPINDDNIMEAHKNDNPNPPEETLDDTSSKDNMSPTSGKGSQAE